MLTATALLATWARSDLIDSSSFADTSTDLIKDKTIRDEVARYLVAETAGDQLPADQRRALRRQVSAELGSQRSVRVWNVATEDAHSQENGGPTPLGPPAAIEPPRRAASGRDLRAPPLRSRAGR